MLPLPFFIRSKDGNTVVCLLISLRSKFIHGTSVICPKSHFIFVHMDKIHPPSPFRKDFSIEDSIFNFSSLFLVMPSPLFCQILPPSYTSFQDSSFCTSNVLPDFFLVIPICRNSFPLTCLCFSVLTRM